MTYHSNMTTQVIFFFQAEDGIRPRDVTGVQTCALPISQISAAAPAGPTGGSFSWTVPNDISSTYDIKVRVSDPNDPEANDLSDAAFKIEGALAVTSPKDRKSVV